MEHSHNIADLVLAHRSSPRAAKLAVCCGDGQLTYAELGDHVLRAANVLGGLGVRQGERVMLLLHDTPDFMAAFFGAAVIGAIPVPVNTLLAASEYEYLVNHSGATLLLVQSELLPMVPEIGSRCSGLRQVVVVGAEEQRVPCWGELLRAARAESPVVRMAAQAPAFWLYSSGSSGAPKAVVHAQRSIGVTCEQYARETVGLQEDDVCFSAAKLFHAYGLGNGMNFPLHAGARSVLWPGPPLAEALFEQIERHRPTVFFATPALYHAMLQKAAEGRSRDMSSLRLCVSAGEALPGSILERWQERFGLEILDGIGSTEMLHIFISNRPGDAKGGSSGVMVPGYEAKVVDESGNAVATGVVGDLLVRGDSATSGYFGDPERTAKLFRDGWVVTGDKYVQDEQGFFRFCGRSDDMLKVNGLWVSPVELEHILNEHPAVRESAVVAIQDDAGLTQIRAFVVPCRAEEAGGGLARQLQAFVKRRLPQRYPRDFAFLSALPRTATGKIKRFELRQVGAAPT
jgi:benzoate-CoA ligase